MAISKKMLEELAQKLDLYEEAANLLKNTICDRYGSLFTIRFLVLSYTESYLISHSFIGGVNKITASLSSVEFDQTNMIYVSDINPVLNSHCDLCPYIDKILNDFIPIRLFRKCFFGLYDLNNKWNGNKVLLVFFIDESQIFDPFYVSLIYEFYCFVKFDRFNSYNDVYRISENAAHLTLQKTLPFDQKMCLGSREGQKQYVLLDLIMRTMNDVSSLYYESSECKGYFQFVENNNKFHGIKLKNEVSFHSMNDRIIRKLLEAAKTYPLVVYNGDIIGIATEKIHCQHEYILRVLGHLAWEYRINDVSQFICANSLYKIPSSHTNSQLISSNLKKFFNLGEEDIGIFLDIVNQASKGHGALIIITDNAEAESERLCLLNRGIQIQPFYICEDSQGVISDLSTIDGAVILDNTLKCYAFGVILDGEAVLPGTPSRGSRYNSAKNYVMLKQKKDSKHKYMAIVISEDGMVNVFPSDYSQENTNYFAFFDVFKS